MKTLTKCVIASYMICIIYAVVAIILECFGITLNDTLTQYFYITFGIEFGSTAAITIVKQIVKRKEVKDTVEEIKANNLEVEKSDLKPNTDEFDDNSGGMYYG